MVDQLAQEYANRPVIFLEQNVDATLGNRYGRWWAAYGGGSVLLPLMMTESGHQLSNGSVDFASVYRNMIETELARAPLAELEAYSWRAGNTLRFSGRFTNRSGQSLSTSANGFMLHGLVYEEARVIHTGRIVRAAPYESNPAPLADGATVTFDITSPELTGVDWSKLHALVLGDYRPGGGNAYDSLQAAQAVAPALTLQPSAVSFLIDPAGATTLSTTVQLLGPPNLNWSVSESLPWLEVSPTGGTLAASTPTLVLTASGLNPGMQQGQLNFVAGNGADLNLTQVLTVSAYLGSVNFLYLPLVRR